MKTIEMEIWGRDGLGIEEESPQADLAGGGDGEDLERKARPTKRRKPPHWYGDKHSFFRFKGKEKDE
jgi:hypothetical protein